MRNKQPSGPSKNGLPVPAASAGPAPVLTDHAQLDADLGALERGVDGCRMYGTFIPASAAGTVSCLKAALPFIETKGKTAGLALPLRRARRRASRCRSASRGDARP